VVRAGREEEVRRAFRRYELHAMTIGRVTDEPVIRATYRGETICEVPGRALADEAPTYIPPAAPPSGLAGRRAERLDDLAAEPPTAATLLNLLGGHNARSRRPIWRRYDHMNGINTLVGPGQGDAALLRIKGTSRALALALDGPGRLGDLDPRLAAASAVLEGAMNVACTGARPIGVTNCLNFASPERPAGYWQLAEAIDGMADACRALGIPIVSGNVSLYNETPDGPILPTPVIGTVGLLEDRSHAVPMAWAAGDELWLLGDPAADAASLAASELAWRRARSGGAPRIDLDAAARLVALLAALSGAGIAAAAHDLSVGGLGVALARMAVAAGCGATITLPDSAAAVPSAALFGERVGRAIVGIRERDSARLDAACREAGVPAARLGIAGGDQLRIGIGGATVELAVSALVAAWETAF